VKSEIATFFDAFPNGVIFANTVDNAGYDLVLLGQVEPTHINVDAWQEKLDRPEYRVVASSLREIGFPTVVELLGTYAGRASDMKGWLKDAAINRDRNLRLQYLAGLGFNLRMSGVIYNDMDRVPAPAGRMFYGSDRMVSMVWDTIENPPRVERRRISGWRPRRSSSRPHRPGESMKPKSTRWRRSLAVSALKPARTVLASFSL